MHIALLFIIDYKTFAYECQHVYVSVPVSERVSLSVMCTHVCVCTHCVMCASYVFRVLTHAPLFTPVRVSVCARVHVYDIYDVCTRDVKFNK